MNFMKDTHAKTKIKDMKTNFLILLIAIMTFGLSSCNENKAPVSKVSKDTITNKEVIKVVFIVANNKIDFNKMNIDDIVTQIENDSLLEIKAISPEINIPPRIVKVYRVEDITCPFLKKRFKNNDPGELVYEYNGKILVKLKDGVIKVYHSHPEK